MKQLSVDKTKRKTFAFLIPTLFGSIIGLGKDSTLPKPNQVDKLEIIRFIKPDPMVLPGIVADDTEAKLVGQWKHSVHTPPFVGKSYLHDMKEGKGEKSATFTPNLPKAGLYEVHMSHSSNIRRANGVPVTIRHAATKPLYR